MAREEVIVAHINAAAVGLGRSFEHVQRAYERLAEPFAYRLAWRTDGAILKDSRVPQRRVEDLLAKTVDVGCNGTRLGDDH